MSTQSGVWAFSDEPIPVRLDLRVVYSFPFRVVLDSSPLLLSPPPLAPHAGSPALAYTWGTGSRFISTVHARSLTIALRTDSQHSNTELEPKEKLITVVAKCERKYTLSSASATGGTLAGGPADGLHCRNAGRPFRRTSTGYFNTTVKGNCATVTERRISPQKKDFQKRNTLPKHQEGLSRNLKEGP